MRLYRRGSIWWCDFTVAGERFRVSTDEATKSAAQTAADNLRARALQGAGLKPVPVPTLKDWARAFLEAKANQQGLGEDSKILYRYGWKIMSTQPIAKLRLDRITTQDVLSIQTDKGPSKHNAALRTLSCMLHMAVDQGLIRRDRAPGEPRFPVIKYLRENRRKDRITAEDDELISANLGGCLVHAWAICADTTLRPKEVVNLRVEHINLFDKKLYVARSKSEASERFLPITPRMMPHIVFQMAGRSSGWLFPGRKAGTHITRTTLTAAFRVARAKAGLPATKVLYGTRHGFARDLMKRSGDPYLVAAAMGHSNLRIGAVYQGDKTVEEVSRAMEGRVAHA